MTIRCFFLGCKWGEPYRWQLGSEWLETKHCKRCGMIRTRTKA